MSKGSKSLMVAGLLAASLMTATAIQAQTAEPTGDTATAPKGSGGMPMMQRMPMMQMMQQMGEMMSQCSSMMKRGQDGNAAPDQAPPSASDNPHKHH